MNLPSTDAQMDAAAQAALAVGREHGFAAMLSVVLLIVVGAGAWFMIRTHLKLATRLATAQENSYDNHVEFAKQTQEATKQMAASTKIIEQAIVSMVDAGAIRSHVLEDIKRRSAQVHRAAKELVEIAAEHMEKTEPRIAMILRRVADDLSKE